MNVESGFELDDLWGIVRRRGKLALAVAGGVGLAAYWVAMALPNEYESYATVLVEPQAISPELVRAGVAESDLTERLHIMTAQILSRPRLSRIIDDAGLYEDEQEELLREQIIDLMRDRIRVEPVIPELQQAATGRRTEEAINQFRIYFSDQDPIVAKEVAERLANDFIERHIQQRVETSQKSVDFLEGELDRLATRIEEVEARVAAVKAANPGRLPEDMGANQQQLQRLAAELAASQRSLAVARSDEGFYRSQVAAASALGGGGADDASPARRLEVLELALSDYEARGYTEKHPDVVKARLESEAIRQRLEKLEKEGEDVYEPPSFAQQSAQAEADRAALRVASAEDEVARLGEALEDIQRLLAETPAVAEQLDALEREYQHLFGSYQDFSRRRLEATVQAQLERRQLGEQFRVLEAAFEAPEPSSPNRPLIVVIGVLFGIIVGGGLAVVLESTDASVHSARQLQAMANLPVLASIPEIWLDADRAAQRRKRMRQALATAAVVAFALVGGAANYAWVNGMPGLGRSEPAGEVAAPPAAGPGAPAVPGAPPAAGPGAPAVPGAPPAAAPGAEE
jgi:polysaccharide chain length determinant protein (PEP-CTERM system associated)